MDMGWRMYMKIVILERNSVGLDISVEGFSRFGEVITYPNTVTEEEVIERIEDADVVVGNKAPLTEKTLQGAKNVKLICEFATGYDNVDLAYCSKHGIKVANVRNYSTDAVAQHTFALCLYVLEKLRHYDEYVKDLGYHRHGKYRTQGCTDCKCVWMPRDFSFGDRQEYLYGL